ncbi:MAG: primosomal protein N' [Armatimonadetes bacterium]|nr:primosomal protein N' [Armatimonadota bacterium]
MVADVGLDAKSAGSQAVYTYLAGQSPVPVPGEAYFVPLGPRRAIGYVLAVREADERSLGFAPSRLRPLGARVEGLALPSQTLDLVREVARQTLSPMSVALTVAVPPSVRERLVTTWRAVDPRPTCDEPLTTAQQEALRVLKDHGGLTDSKAAPLADGAKSSLRALERRGLAVQSVELSRRREDNRLTGHFRLTADQAKVETFLTGPGKRRPAQTVTLMRLQGSESASFSVQEIKSLGGVTDQTIKALVQAGLLEEESGSPSGLKAPPRPNDHQQAAIDAIGRPLREGRHEEFLLFGVTGSGKTEVYLRCAAEALKRGRQVLYLVPEIALTAQVIAQLRERFGDQVAVVHSNMTPAERLDSWLKVKNGECPVVLGPRSAVFAPLTNVGLIVVDEEHESSYKQENAPRYQTKALASYLGRLSGCPVVYGSATPSIESFFAAERGDTTLLRLPSRAAEAVLPTVEVVDLAQLYRERRPSVLSPQLDDKVREALARQEQAILFLNRRAYSPFLICRDCGHRFMCPHCAVSLAFHRRDRKMRCHQCGHQEDVTETCPECGGTRVAPFGTGTEKVEETVQALFPDAKVSRLDRDVARKKGALEETIAAFRSRTNDILVGTQMVAKGLDFPNVTVVGVVAADVSLNVPDFRAGERTFQLLSQVAGRAGRGTSPGTVVIQTLSPTNEAVLCARDHEYEGFYRSELEQRREAGYPPFKRLVNVLVTGENRQDVVGLAAVAGQRLRLALAGVEVLGPVDCPIERLQNLWRRHILVKMEPGSDPGPVRDALEGLKASKARLVIDVDPASLV